MEDLEQGITFIFNALIIRKRVSLNTLFGL